MTQTIHHATIKRAASLGLSITADRAGRVTISGEIFPGVESEWWFPNTDATSVSTYAKDMLQAVYQARVYAKEYGLEIKQSALGGFTVHIPGGQHVKGTDLLDVLTRAVDKATARRNAEAAVRPAPKAKAAPKKAAPVADEDESEDGEEVEEESYEEVEEEEVPESGSVVKDKYRERYREEGHPDDCGDVVAGVMAKTLKASGELDIDRLWKLAQANGIEYTKYMTGNRGWQGRARMSIGNVLRGRLRRGEGVNWDI